MAECFVTGVTGFVGAAVADRLVAEGFDVTGLTSSEGKLKSIAARGIRPILGDMRDPSAWGPTARRAAVIVHTAQVPHGIRLSRLHLSRLAEADRTATHHLLAVAGENCRCLIYTSGAWVYGDCGERLLDEGTELIPYSIAQYRLPIEKLVLDRGQYPRSLQTYVLRLGMVYGLGGLFKKFNVDPIEHGRRIWYPGSGRQVVAPIFISDCAAAYQFCIRGEIRGGIYNVVDDHPVEIGEMTCFLAHKLGGKKPIGVPTTIVRLAAGSLVGDPLLGSTRVSNHKLRALGFELSCPTYREGTVEIERRLSAQK